MLVYLPALLQQPTLILQRKLEDGHANHYEMAMTEHLDSIDADVNAHYDETITRNATNWQLTVATTSFSISAGGQDVPAPQPNPHTFGLDRNGQMVGDGFLNEASISHMIPDVLASYALGLSLSVGKGTDIAPLTDPQTKEKIIGTATLNKEDSGKAVVEIELSITYPESKTPMKLKETATFDVATGEIDHAEGMFTDLPPRMTSRYQVQSADFKVRKVGHERSGV